MERSLAVYLLVLVWTLVAMSQMVCSCSNQYPNPVSGCNRVVSLARGRCHRLLTTAKEWSARSDALTLTYWRCMSRDGIHYERPVGTDY